MSPKSKVDDNISPKRPQELSQQATLAADWLGEEGYLGPHPQLYAVFREDGK